MRNRWDRAEAVRPQAVAITAPAYHDIIPQSAVKRPSSRHAVPVDLRCPFVPPSPSLSDAFLSALSAVRAAKKGRWPARQRRKDCCTPQT
jgi:Ni,Fe-hydrogenase III small subunit